MKKIYSFCILLSFFVVFTSFQTSPKLNKSAKKEIITTFNTENFSLEEVQVSGNLNNKLPVKIANSNFSKVVINNVVKGYLFLEKAPSKTAEFDYMVLFDLNGLILKSKVLAYREEYGGEIGSTRWQKQFIGKGINDKLEYKKNIDAISGATISVRSMIHSVNDVLQTVRILKENKII